MSPRSVAVVLTALAATATLAPPAAAEVQVHRDPRGDVRQLGQGGDAGARGQRSSADVLRLTGTHEGATLTFTLDVADLTRSGNPSALVRMRTPNGTEFNAAAYRGDESTEVVLYRGLGDATVRCPGLEGRFLGARDRITLEVPRSCVQRPRWVRFGAVAASEGRRTYADDARRDGRVGGGLPRLGTQRLERD